MIHPCFIVCFFLFFFLSMIKFKLNKNETETFEETAGQSMKNNMRMEVCCKEVLCCLFVKKICTYIHSLVIKSFSYDIFVEKFVKFIYFLSKNWICKIPCSTMALLLFCVSLHSKRKPIFWFILKVQEIHVCKLKINDFPNILSMQNVPMWKDLKIMNDFLSGYLQREIRLVYENYLYLLAVVV